jgi:hypothetical protein
MDALTKMLSSRFNARKTVVSVMEHANKFWVLLLAGALTSGGCAFGPKALELSHSKYYEAVRDVRNEELLLNLVHLRYNENSAQLNVDSIAAQYELGSTLEARPFFIAPNPSNSNVIFRTFTSILPDASISGANRPTLTLDPTDDSEAVRQFLTPITPDTLIFLIQSGWPASTIVRLYVQWANGVPNAALASGPHRDTEIDFARFQRAAELMQLCQDRELALVHVEDRMRAVGEPLSPDAIVEATKNGLDVRRSADGKSWVLVRQERAIVLVVTPGAGDSPELLEFNELLNLEPHQPRYDIVFAQRGPPDPRRHPVPPTKSLTIVPRSTAQAWYYLANGIEVPPDHIAAGLVRPSFAEQGQQIDAREITRGLFEVHVCKGHKPPHCAYVAVHYRGYWYYIDDSDTTTKATFSLMLNLGRLDFAKQRVSSKPMLTLPVGR